MEEGQQKYLQHFTYFPDGKNEMTLDDYLNPCCLLPLFKRHPEYWSIHYWTFLNWKRMGFGLKISLRVVLFSIDYRRKKLASQQNLHSEYPDSDYEVSSKLLHMKNSVLLLMSSAFFFSVSFYSFQEEFFSVKVLGRCHS